MEDYKHICDIANKDVDTLIEKGRAYGDSWRKRGGVGAFMMLARKWDRLENQVGDHYDIFKAIQKETDAGITKDGLLDDIRDLRAYLLLVESHMTAPKCGWDPAQVGGDKTVSLALSDEELAHIRHVAMGVEPGPGYVCQDPDYKIRPEDQFCKNCHSPMCGGCVNVGG